MFIYFVKCLPRLFPFFCVPAFQSLQRNAPAYSVQLKFRRIKQRGIECDESERWNAIIFIGKWHCCCNSFHVHHHHSPPPYCNAYLPIHLEAVVFSPNGKLKMLIESPSTSARRMFSYLDGRVNEMVHHTGLYLAAVDRVRVHAPRTLLWQLANSGHTHSTHALFLRCSRSLLLLKGSRISF